MKRLFSIILLCAILSGCGILGNSCIPKGYSSAEEHFDSNGFQDYTDYCKYIYPENSAERFAAKGYSEVNEADVENLAGYFENFSGWMEVENRSGEFDFDASCINEGDYFIIESKEGTPIGSSAYGKYDDYTVYFFDIETDTLYYIHTNI